MAVSEGGGGGSLRPVVTPQLADEMTQTNKNADFKGFTLKMSCDWTEIASSAKRIGGGK